MTTRQIRILGILGAAIFLTGAASAEPPRIDARTRLQTCGADVCLLVSGHRTDASAPVAVAGHDVAVQGGRMWRVAVPLDMVRSWSAPFARSIHVSVAGGAGGQADARLPIGLLGQSIELAFLDVSARH